MFSGKYYCWRFDLCSCLSNKNSLSNEVYATSWKEFLKYFPKRIIMKFIMKFVMYKNTGQRLLIRTQLIRSCQFVVCKCLVCHIIIILCFIFMLIRIPLNLKQKLADE